MACKMADETCEDCSSSRGAGMHTQSGTRRYIQCAASGSRCWSFALYLRTSPLALKRYHDHRF